MFLSISEWVQRLSNLDLPVLRSTSAELAGLAPRQDRISAGEIDDVILLDPLMAIKVLRHVNRVRRSRLSSQITTVEHAVMMLGVYPFFNLFAVNPLVEDYFSGKKEALDYLMALFCRAQHGAYQARDWALLRQDIESEEVYVAALMCNMAEMLLLCTDPDAVLRMNVLVAKGVSPVEAQQTTFGFELKNLQAALVTEWRISEILEDMNLPNVSAKPRLMSVSIACQLAQDAENGWYGESMTAHMEKIADVLHHSVDEMTARIHHTAVLSARHSKLYGVTPAAAWLPMMVNMEDEKITIGSENWPSCQPSKVQEALGQIDAHMDGSLELNEMMALALKGLTEGVGLNRVAFALLSKDHKVLKGRYVITAGEDPSFRDFQLDMSQNHLFRHLINKQQAVWLNDDNRKQIGPLVTSEIRHIIGGTDFFAMSAFVKGKPVGLFYGDRSGSGDCPLDDASYQAFKKICMKACEGLEHLAVKK